jgi:hypothetical protein
LLLAERRSLEDIVLEVTGAGTDQFGVPAAKSREAPQAPDPPDADVPEPAPPTSASADPDMS